MGLFNFSLIKRQARQDKKAGRATILPALGNFMGKLVHDVNNPLMVISGRAQLSMMDAAANDELKKNLQIICDESQRAKDILTRALNSVRPAKAMLKSAQVNKILEELIALIEEQFSREKVAIKKEYAGDLPLVSIDEKMMREVFLSLLTNCREAMPEGGWIKVSTARCGDRVEITFQDSGCGMAAGVMDRLFEPFFTTKEKGVGLGLTLCYNTVKAHGGELKLESSAGKGTVAVILLPVITAGGAQCIE